MTREENMARIAELETDLKEWQDYWGSDSPHDSHVQAGSLRQLGIEQARANRAVNQVSDLQARIADLEAAIRAHRDQKADDRCWLDDVNLYAVLKDGVEPVNTMPPREAFLSNCQRFYDRRCKQGFWPSYQYLENACGFLKAANEKLEERITELKAALLPFAQIGKNASGLVGPHCFMHKPEWYERAKEAIR